MLHQFKFKFWKARWLFSLLCGVVFQGAQAERLSGLERMERLDRLPELLSGTQVRQVSSYDRSGGNDDGFNGTYSALYLDENGEYVLFDEMGAGCLYRFWMTYGTTPAGYDQYRLRFYFDGETTPRLDMTISNFFDGVGTPLEYPLVGDFLKSSHGCYCYLPFPYQSRLKITLSGEPRFYQMTYHRFDTPDGMVSWTGSEDSSGILAQWNAVGEDPKSTVSNLVVSGNMPIAAGATGVVFQTAGKGAIQSIKLDPSPSTEEILSKVWIQMNWDGGELEVDVPLGDFFGSGKHEIFVTALPVGMKTSGDWYCYFPMPYWTSAEIRLVNKGDEPLTALPFEIQYSTNAYDQATTGYFRALFHEESFVGNGEDFNFIDESGRGHLVGLSLFMESSGAGGYRDMNYLEGDERLYVDGSLSPSVHGTGTEDYFNCGWYFNQGTFSRPYHGHPWRDQFHDSTTNYTQAFRFHLSDIIPFNHSVKFGMEHGPANDAPGTFSSVVYYYKVGEADSGMVPVVNLDLGDDWAESLYNYGNSASVAIISNSWKYGGDEDAELPDEGYAFSNATVHFSVPLVENSGILLRRRCDQGMGGQRAEVYVDQVLAGIWYEADHNFSSTDRRWLDSDFMIPAGLLAGKSLVDISIVPTSNLWNAYRYAVYCVKPFEMHLDTDGDKLPDAWELEQAGSLGILDGDSNLDGDGYSDFEEYIAGTDPTNSASFPAILPRCRIESQLGRLYDLQKCTNLFSNDWKTVRSDIPGNGALMDLPQTIDGSTSYFRVLVEKP